MNLEFSAEDLEFRDAVREFFAREYPQHLLAKIRQGQRLTREDHIASQQALQSRRWLGVGWPAEFGGSGWTPTQRYLFDEELERSGAPNIIPMAVIYIGPILIAFGTPEQQQRWLPDILASRSMWAQGYSEPESGSDLASLNCKAVRDGDDYVLNGTKVWTTLAHWADWMFLLVRTSRHERKQEGITFLCADMRSSGVTVHPIITMNGAWELNRVTFDNVRVPMANRIGEEGRGWHYANVLLQNERLSYAHIGRKKADVAQIRAMACRTWIDGDRSLIDDPLFGNKLASLEIQIAALEISVLRTLAGDQRPAIVSLLKIACTECAQRVTELQMELAARAALPYPDRSQAGWHSALSASPVFGPLWADAYLFERAQTIYGGATEIQKNIAWREIGK
ncbi:MAG: acyl-CoA dehydrogenase family protein [Steroidobacteraceae bacterium]